MKERVLSGLLMLPLLMIVVLGGNVLLIGCGVIGIWGVREFFDGFRKMGINPSRPIAYVSGLALLAINLAINWFELSEKWYMFWFSGVVIACLLYLFSVEKRKLEDGAATMTGIFYVVFFSFHVALTEQIDGYSVLVWLIFLTAFGTDIMAYFTGYAIGKHKLCPNISPKKTIEGSIGGILGSVILCGLFGHFFAYEVFIHCLIIGALGGVISQLGDLTASIFKRKMGIKDYGKLIPGHGGILDRFDSVLFTAPMVYYYVIMIM